MDDMRPGLVRPVRLDSSGRTGPTRGQARNASRWRRSSHGHYVPADVDATLPEQRIVEAAAALPDRCAITGWAALRWLGGSWFTGVGADGRPLPVTLLISTHDVRPQPGIEVCGEGAGRHDILRVHGLAVTSPAWSTAFLMRRAASPLQAVVDLDMTAYSDLVSLDEVAAVIAQQSSWTGVPQARWALARGSENAWSPMEVRARLAWTTHVEDARPEANRPVFDLAGRHLGTPDLLEPTAGIAVEYDGLVHLGREQRRADRTRDEVFAAHGIELVRWLSGDGVDDFLRRLTAAHRGAALRDGPRTWTTVPPPWWTPTTTVAARRQLSASQRARLLRYRTA
ncbi:hypothetical protein KG112_08995 [Nocardioides sp. zg-ZUI104]|uniref:hypothetical protein n=1 Tax=Nocardioides faecalis TaxID=2803858 RepID=UPI001BCDFB30|nr:hypothetical protein [Nocardioides faecalis]MBS4752941.1 hypothetical protein [Nocardioides faecalis]